MLDFFLNKYKSLRRNKILNRRYGYKKSYAIIGAGDHNLANIYPCLWHLGVPVKKICTYNKATASKAATMFTNCIGTDKIEEILQDQSIRGVVVCTKPELHSMLATLLLNHNKHVFVEKPLAHSIAELNTVISAQKDLICHVGLQRRFSKVTQILKKLCKNSLSYNYKFLVGAYPEGNAIYDLFIHPIDFVLWLFGNATIEHISVVKENGGKTFFVILTHAGVKGAIELSTNYSWQRTVDHIVISTSSQTITAHYPDHVSAINKVPLLLNMPLEKIALQPIHQKIYLDTHNFTHTGVDNSVNIQGFYPELQSFVNAVENDKSDEAHSDAKSLIPVYNILEQLDASAAD